MPKLTREMPDAVDAVIRAFPPNTRIGLVVPQPQPEYATAFADGTAIVRSAVLDAPARFPGRDIVAFDLAPDFEGHWDEYGAADHIHYTDAGKEAYVAFLVQCAQQLGA